MKVIVTSREGRFWSTPGDGDWCTRAQAYKYDLNDPRDVLHIERCKGGKPHLIGVIEPKEKKK